MTSKVTYCDIISLLPEYLMAFSFLLQSTDMWLQWQCSLCTEHSMAVKLWNFFIRVCVYSVLKDYVIRTIFLL